jgi:Leucine-rich repeat (LRR) protein
LDTLLANNNNLNNLPASIITLSKLTYLNLSYDSLTELPDNINQMDSLQFLFLNNNKLTTLPGKIIYLKIPLEHVFLRRFRPNCESTCGYFIDTLTYNLFLSGNQLCNLPDSINNWVNQYAPGDLQKQICANGVKYVSKIQPSSLLKMTQTPSGLMISGTSLPDENLELKVISTNGRLIKSDKLHGSSGQLSYMLQKSFLAKGMNIIQISGINCRYLLHTIVK